MRTTTQIPRKQWQAYFDDFTHKYLPDDSSGLVAIRAMSMRIGDQVYSQNTRLMGLSYDPKDDVFEVQLSGSDHLMFRPKEIWVLETGAEEEDDLVAIFEVVGREGTKELLHVRKVGPLVQRTDSQYEH
jgi:hypothetical protein